MKTFSHRVLWPRLWCSQRATGPGSAGWLGFTRVELAAVMGCLALLAGLVGTALANTQEAGERAWCVNNLRLIGRALQVWGKDHDHFTPWRLLVASGGTQASPRAGAAWYEFAFLSNQLVTPKILVCPSDDQKRVARDFSRDADGGFVNSAYRDNALSYWIGLDAGYVAGSLDGIEASAEHAISGDRNLRVDMVNAGCSSGVNNAAGIYARPPGTGNSGWTNSLHRRFGNMVLNDGRVLQLSTPAMRQAMSRADDQGTVHLLIP